MVHLKGMVHEGRYMVEEAKLWYDYIIMLRSGNAAFSLLYTMKKMCHNIYQIIPWLG